MIYFLGNKKLFEGDLYQSTTLEYIFEYFKWHKCIQLDTESDGGDPHNHKLLSLQLGDSNNQFVIDTQIYSINLFKELLESGVLLILQNAKHDYKLLKSHGIMIENIYDTFIAECVLTTGIDNRSLGLGSLVGKYCNYYHDKSVRGSINYEGFSDRVIKYCADDVTWLEVIRDNQLKQIEELELDNLLQLEFDAIKGFADMEYNGITLDKDKWLEIESVNKQLIDKQLEKLDDIIKSDPKFNKFIKKYVQGELFADVKVERVVNINWNSSQQVTSVLAIEGINEGTVNAKDIAKYTYKPIVKEYIEYKKYQKLVSTYGKDFLKYINPVTNRVHTSFWQILETGRVGSKDPNMQNLPADNTYRNPFIATEGYTFVDCDYGSQELMLIAEDSDEENWITAANNGYDLHSVVAELVFKDKWKNTAQDDCQYYIDKQKCKCKEHKKFRDKIKTVNYALCYGATKFKLSQTLNITPEEAQQLINEYFKAIPKMKTYLDKVASYGKAFKMIRTFRPFRRIRFFKDPDLVPEEDRYKELGSIERQSKNTRIQGSAADQVKLALHYLREEIKNNNYPVKLILQVHDQILTECKDEFVDKWKIIMPKLMEKAASINCHKVNIKADCTVSKFWCK